MKKFFALLLSLSLLLQGAPALAAEGPYAGKTVILYSGNLKGHPYYYPLMAQWKKDYAAQGGDVILADVGNCIQGSALANSTRGEAIYTLMDAAGYDVAAMGLAEFSYADATTGYIYHGNVKRYHTQAMLRDGCEEITYNVNKDGSQTAVLPAKAPATFQTVCSNLTALKEGTYSFLPSVTVTTPGGRQVRFYGWADPDIPRNVQDGYVAFSQAPVEEAPGADLTVCLSNAEAAPEVLADVTISVSDRDAGTAGACVIDNATGAVTWETLFLDYHGTGGDPDVARLAETLNAAAPEIIGSSAVVLNGSDKVNWNRSSNLGELTADALKWYAENYVDGVDKSLPFIAIQNGGNCDAFLYPGEITKVDLLRALPFSPMGVGVMEVTGAQLLETLEAATQTPDCPGFAQVAGLRYTLDATQPYDAGAAYGKYFMADSVNRVTITGLDDGTPFDPEATYNLVCDNFLINGNDTYYTLKNAKEAGAKYINNGPGVKTRNVVAMYIQQVLGGVVACPQGVGRVTVQTFSDVPPDHWAFFGSAWAVENGVTQGTGEGQFSPDRECTVWEIETFLNRALGRAESPMPEDSPLCTRAMAAERLWQAAGAPEPSYAYAEFADVTQDHPSAKAIAWARENGIMNGVGDDLFAPDKTCTRGEIAAMLQRYFDHF